MPINNPTPEKLPLCSAFAEQGKHLVFAGQLEMLKQQYRGFHQNTVRYLDGMLAAYLEQGLISTEQFKQLGDELITFAIGDDV